VLAKATVEEVQRRNAQVQCLLAIANVYAAQATISSTSQQSPSAGGPSTQQKDDSWLSDAVDAVQYAREISPTTLLPDIHAALASLASQGGSASLAVRHYESALVLDAAHTGALLGLARIETQRVGGNLVLAYGYLVSALQIDATSHHAWYEMGVILQAQGKSSAAAEHFMTSLELESTAPIVSFEFIPRIVA
jgi:tetratricopeptide (TPR) repeat protein